MKKNLGSGKIAFPRLENVVVRERLFSQLDTSQNKLITWVSGPPGAGKTTLVSSYLTERKKPYLWVRCDKTDNDIGSFISYLSFAAEQAQRGLGKALPTFTPEYAGDVEPFVRNYMRSLLEGLKRASTIVLDDFHEVQVKGVLAQSLSAMAEEFNCAHTFIIISRKPIIENLARLQLNQQLLHIDWSQLQLTEAETQDFVELQGNKQDQARVKILHKLCKGWIAALKMIVLSDRIVDPKEPPTEDDLDQTLFFNYLAQETFNHLKQGQKQTLMQLSLTPSITKQHLALAANEECNVAQIEKLLDQQLVQKFSKPVAHYKFHPLYKEFLQQQAEENISETSRTQTILASADSLLKQELTFEAAELYMQLNHHEKLAEIVLKYGETMYKQGRLAELEKLLNNFPQHYFDQQPWLRYWLASSLIATNQSASQKNFEQVFEQFLVTKDVNGIYLSWCGALEACLYAFGDISFLENWLSKLEIVRKNFPKYPSLEIRMKVLGMRLFSYYMGYSQKDSLDSSINICYQFIRFAPIPFLQVIIGTQLAGCLFSKGDGLKYSKVTEIIRGNLDNSSVPPFHRMAAYFQVVLHDATNFTNNLVEVYDQSLKYSEKVGIHHFDVAIKDQFIAYLLDIGELDKAKKLLDEIFKDNESLTGIRFLATTLSEAIFEYMSGNILAARVKTEDCLEQCKEQGYRMPQVVLLNICAEILSEIGEYDVAERYLNEADSIVMSINSKMLKFNTLVSRSVVALNMNNTELLINNLSKAFSLGNKIQVYTYKGIVRNNILKLCVSAFEHGIELGYAAKLVELFKFSYPQDQSIIEQWPWKLKLHVLNEFNAKLDGGSISAKNKSQGKTLELLQVLTAIGGQNVEGWRIAEVLWPDSEADTAQQSLDTTIHRLRKIISKEAIVVQNNKLSLSKEHCWTDVWQFEALVGQLDALFEEDVVSDEVFKQTKQLLHIYTGPLLQNIDDSWIIFNREKYAAEFLRVMDRSVEHLYVDSNYGQVIELAHQAITRVPDRENFYLHAMQSYQALGQNSKALDIFRRCEQTFKLIQGSSLSSQMLELTDSLK